MARNNQLELLFNAPAPAAGDVGERSPLEAHTDAGGLAGADAGARPAAPAPALLEPGTGPAASSPGTPAPRNGGPGPGFSLAPSSPLLQVPTPCPPTLPDGARWRVVQAPQQAIGFVLQRSRRRSIGFVVTDDGLRVTAPNWVTLKQIDEAVLEKSRWILTKLLAWHDRKEQMALSQTRWQPGGALPYLGKRIVISLGSHDRHAALAGDADAPLDGDLLRLALPADADGPRVRDAAQAWLQQRAGVWFGARLGHFLQVSGLKIKRWRLSSAATRWGSCTSDGHIMLNWRLIHFAPAIIDYVIAHELAHLREMNHSSNFWAEVGHILPEYEQARDILRRHDPASLPTF
ncbi:MULTISPECIES: M48 family metallopeptidase [unclassified Achromobacter]|uniref:M48 family metallopeptidase n=1 Tax=unclassified Achromobacter TaxID=2626865 RepID=UPI000B519915|nr:MULTISPECIES: SprT family zinc-dependent metalloprotease [unclassified Achromobacter]OWT71600.1 hypothetical protein CEY05_25800 [Achromobacter sp. HZ34]OWT73257.1 hypothetical protein CEY04_24635 [Achromobacter sp. HZ28]